jgi:hypothetical protein
MDLRSRVFSRRTAVAALGGAALAVGVLSGVASNLSSAAARPSTTTVAVGGGTCQEWMCGTNHNQVLV